MKMIQGTQFKKNLVTGVLAAAILVGLAGTGFAGRKSSENVTITVNGTSATVVGAYGTVRASSDSNQYLTCTLQGFSWGNMVFCNAQNATATKSFSCSATATPGLAASLSAIGIGSRLFVYAESGVCQQIDVTNGSDNRPMVP